jgi:CarD family transcriptional regulator
MAQKKKNVAKPMVAKASTVKSKVAPAPVKAVAKPAAKPAKPSAAKPAAAKAASAKPVAKAAVKPVVGKKPNAPAKPAVTAAKSVAPAAKPADVKKPAQPVPAKAAAPAAAPKAPVVASKGGAPGKAALAIMAAQKVAQAQAQAQAQSRVMPAAVAKASGQTISAPASPKALAERAAQARQAQVQQAANDPKKPVNQRHGFKTNEWIVYPSHGVGRIVGIEEQEIAGMSLELFVIQFEKDKMTLRVPTGKSQAVGMRKLSDDNIVKRAMETLKGKARIKRTMWSRRAQEFEAKINSGDLVSIAEVVRDLYRSESQPEQSYSERQLYEAALDRMSREIAAVEKLDERGASQRITEVLSKSAKGRRSVAEEADAMDGADEAETKAA